MEEVGKYFLKKMLERYHLSLLPKQQVNKCCLRNGWSYAKGTDVDMFTGLALECIHKVLDHV
jgi:hypothetical protein